MLVGIAMTNKDDDALKTFIMEMSHIPGAMDEIFSFRDPDFNGTGKAKWYHFNATAIRKHIENVSAARQFIVYNIDENHYNHVLHENGVEEAKVQRLSQAPEIYSQPTLIALMPCGRHVQIDGNHRTVILYRMGMRKMSGFVVKEDVWSKFLVPFPDEMADELLR